jgi:sugar phosphate isomerase/epimerase
MRPGITIYSGNQLFGKGGMTVQNFIKYVSELGFEGIDIGYYWKDRAREIKECPKWLEDSGITLSGYIVGNDFGKVVGTGKEQEEIDKVRQAIDDAALLGTDRLRVFAGSREDMSFDDGRKPVLECFAQCLEHAESNKIILALEDHGGWSSNSKEMLFYINSLSSPYFQACVDIGNFLVGGEQPLDGVRNTAKHAAMVHVKDCKISDDRVDATVVGDGEVDVKGCLQILKNSGYDGYLSLEYEAEEECRYGIETSLKRMKTYLSDIG